MTVRRWWMGFALLLVGGCADGDDATHTPTTLDAEVGCADAGLTCTAPPQVNLVALDAWGRPLEGAAIEANGPLAPVDGRFVEAGDFTLHVTAPDHLADEVTVTWRGERSCGAVTADAALSVMAFDEAADDGCGAFTIFVGLEHTVFASTARPWHSGSTAWLHTESSVMWADVAATVKIANESVHWSTWWWSSTVEVLRDQALDADEAARMPNTGLAILEGLDVGVRRRVLVNEFLGGGLGSVTTDLPLVLHAEDPDDDLEVQVHVNREQVSMTTRYEGVAPPADFAGRVAARPEWQGLTFPPGTLRQAHEFMPAASYHFKGVIVDEEVAFIVGHNSQNEYWDDREHAVFNPRRMPFDATAEARLAVQRRHTPAEFLPFQDYGVRLEGRVVAEMTGYYAAIWNQAIDLNEPYAADATRYEARPPGAAVGTMKVQIQMTLPPPMVEQSVMEAQLKAIRHAKTYILVEDQYWRAECLLAALVEALERRPELLLIVVTNEVEVTNGGLYWSLQMDQALRAVAPDRYLVMQLRAFDVQTAAEAGGDAVLHNPGLYNHSKLMVVDDEVVTLGSANKNNRSMLYDGEMNAMIYDADFGRAARDAVLRAWVGEAQMHRFGDDMVANLATLRTLADENAAVVAWWTAALPSLSDGDIAAERGHAPQGFLYPYTPSGEPVIEAPGPDFF